MDKISILIAEDNLQLLTSIQGFLLKYTKNIVTATNGKKAIEIIKEVNPSILLLDLQMPEATGLEVLKSIKNIHINTIIISGERNLLNQIPMENYDCIKCVLVKPVRLELIYSKINYLLLEEQCNVEISRLNSILNEFDFNKTSQGFQYLTECLIEIIKNPANLKNIEKSLYTIIANKHNFSDIKRIKWCITKTLKSMARYTDNNILNRYCLHMYNITPKLFMAQIYNIIKKN